MIQRIQTVYLLIVTILTGAVLFLPTADFYSLQEGVFELNYKGLIGENGTLITSTWNITLLMAVVLLLSFISIFFYKKRILQIRIIIFNIVLMLGYYALLAYWIFKIKGSLTDAEVSLSLIASFPLINIILSYLAVRAIGKDEALVRSLDRLR
ncbi:MAG: DUF4293 domain-containing protein [Paludibacteraceae bacterium]|nr:DUF4293 domain-containing protein [Paludibacteraceae bacterium]MBO7315736.1 DUF4293 domain-containing protein [Paludibacteraceae bacterium]